MSPPAPLQGKPPSTVIPRWLYFVILLLIFFAGIPLVHGVLPWIISKHMPRYGWAEGRPGIWNLLGLIPVALGVAVLIWVLVVAISHTPKRVELGLTPPFLMRRGPYAFTRNPMYVAELGLWLGWSMLFGSIGVLVGFVGVWAALNFVVLPREERGLEAHLGPLYVQYKNSVPRWIGKSPKRSCSRS